MFRILHYSRVDDFRVIVYSSEDKKVFLRILISGVPIIVPKKTRIVLSMGYNGNTSNQFAGYDSTGMKPNGCAIIVS